MVAQTSYWFDRPADIGAMYQREKLSLVFLDMLLFRLMKNNGERAVMKFREYGQFSMGY